MTYCLNLEGSTQEAIRSVIKEQIGRALEELDDSRLSQADTIHQVRKRCKKIRGALRLVRKSIGEKYSRENAWYRDAARSISDVRDAEVMLETFDAIMERYSDELDGRVMRPVRRELESRKNALVGDAERIEKLLDNFREAMTEGCERLDSLFIEKDGCKVILPGMQKTYNRGRKAMAAAYKKPGPETFHDWRKRVKYHWYHMRLMYEIWPAEMDVRIKEADDLGELLGNHHNLWVLRSMLIHDAEAFARKEVVMKLVSMIDKWTEQIENSSRPMGERLYAEKPNHMARRIYAYCLSRPEKK